MPTVALTGFDLPGVHESMPQTRVVSFADSGSEFLENLLDIINPLQHIPVVSTIYRAITGDEISAPARLIGSALFGGPVGFASATANMVLEEATGSNLADHALALIGISDDTPALAEAAPATATVAPTAQLVASNLAAADNGAEIIWNGPRVLPSLAHAAAVQVRPVEVSALEASDADTSTNAIVAATRDNGTAGPTGVKAVAPNSSARPAWLAAAIADAQSVQNAAQLGKAVQKVEAQPWITEAMLEALSKYQKLSVERNR